MPAPVLQFKRGNAGVAGTVPALRPGEPAISLNNFDFFIGIDTSVVNNKFFGSHRYWGREDGTKSLRLNLVDRNGTNYVAIKSPDTLAGIVTYVLPGTQGTTSTVLTNDGNGNLSWASGSANPVFTGIATFTDTTDNTLGNADTGAVQIDGGLGVNKNVTVGAGLSVVGNVFVAGVSTFVGNVTFQGGTLTLGDSNTDNVVFAADVNSNILPNTDATYDIGDASVSKRWRHASFSGIGTFATGAVIDAVQIGITASGEIDTSSGNLVLDSATGTTVIDDNLSVTGNINCSGNVSVGGTTITLRGTDVYIENKDIVLAFSTTTSPTDTSANHGGIAIASTEGSPLASFSASGINTLPDTYKQLMWFKSGTLGFATDAFAFNYGVAIGTTQMANGLRFKVGSGITMTDTAISATSVNATTVTATTGSFTNLSGSLVGTISTATRATTVDTVTSGDAAATHYLTFVNSHNGTATAETVYTDDGIYYNPGTNTFTTQHGTFTGNVNISGITTLAGNVILGDAAGDTITVNGTATFGQSITGTISTATRATLVDTTTAPSGTFYPGLFVNSTGTASTAVYVDAGISYVSNTDTLTLSGDIAVNGGDVTTSASTFSIVNSNATTVNLAGAATALVMGAATGVATISNATLTLPNATTVNVNGANPTLAGSSTGTLTLFNANLTRVNAFQAATDIVMAATTGITTVRNKLIVGGDLEIDGNDIQASDGNTNITLTSNTLTTFAGDIRVNGNDVQSSTGSTAITLSGSDVTVVGDLQVTGNDIKSSTGAVAITLSANDVTVADDLTVTGNLYVNGSTTQVNTTTLNVKDALVDLGLIDTGGGVLGVPTSDLNKDIGFLLNYYTASAKKAAMFWDDSASRIVFADDVTESSGVLTVAANAYAAIEVESIWVNDCAGQSQLITCTGTTRNLENITIDAGTF